MDADPPVVVCTLADQGRDNNASPRRKIPTRFLPRAIWRRFNNTEHSSYEEDETCSKSNSNKDTPIEKPPKEGN